MAPVRRAPVLTLSIRTVVESDVIGTRPLWTAYRATAVAQLPQLLAHSTCSSPIPTCANAYSTSMPGSADRRTIAALEVVEEAPPTPSIWRGSAAL